MAIHKNLVLKFYLFANTNIYVSNCPNYFFLSERKYTKYFFHLYKQISFKLNFVNDCLVFFKKINTNLILENKFSSKDQNFYRIFATSLNLSKKKKTLVFPFRKVNHNSYFYKLFLSKLTLSYFNFNSSWLFFNTQLLPTTSKLLIFKKSFYKSTFLTQLAQNKNELNDLFIQLVYFKDCAYFVNLLQLYLTKLPLKEHKTTFYKLYLFLDFWFFNLKENFVLKGYAVFFKGKLGRKGSVRKTKFFKKNGNASFSSKNLKLNYQTFQFWTITGVVGGGLSLFF